MDEDFGLPDEGNASGSSFVNELFSNRTKRQSGVTGENRSTIDDILASSTKQRPRVTFQDEQQPTERQTSSVPSASLLDSLFSNSTSGEQRRGTRTANTLSGSVPSAPTPTRGASPSRHQNISQSLEPHSNLTTSIPQSQQTQQQVSASASIQAELEQLKREISSLRYEHSEDQQTISELRRKLEIEQNDHKRTVDRTREENKLELQEQSRRHERELDKIAKETDINIQLLNSIREQQGRFDSLAARFEGLNIGLSQVRDLVKNVNAGTDKMAKDWNEQQTEHWKRLDEERGRLESAEIIEGRKWLEEQRDLSQTERRAFQEEQSLLLDWIEKAKIQLETEKSEFLRREHDLLARVLNERALLEIEKREFRQQRDADILRLREEAEYLEQCLDQTENAKTAMESSKNEFERRSVQLNQLRDVLTRYEHLATRLVRNTQQKMMRTTPNKVEEKAENH